MAAPVKAVAKRVYDLVVLGPDLGGAAAFALASKKGLRAVLVPLVDPPADVPPLVEPVPVCATAKLLANVSAAANPRLLSFITIFSFG